MTNPFEQHDITHLSASQINTWIAQPSYWVATKLLGHKATVGVAADRGTAVEAGLELAAFDPNADKEMCIRAAQTKFSSITAFKKDPKKEAERANVDAMVIQGMPHIREYGAPDKPEEGRQHKIEITLDGVAVPIIGFLDFKFSNHGIIADLKTTTRAPSIISDAHARQGAIYWNSSNNFEVRMIYVTPKKVQPLRLEEPQKYLNQAHQAALNLQKFLSVSADKEELASIVPAPDPSSFYWSSAKETRQEVYGY